MAAATSVDGTLPAQTAAAVAAVVVTAATVAVVMAAATAVVAGQQRSVKLAAAAHRAEVQSRRPLAGTRKVLKLDVTYRCLSTTTCPSMWCVAKREFLIRIHR